MLAKEAIADVSTLLFLTLRFSLAGFALLLIGGCFDEDFAEDSLRILEQARKGKLVLLVSDIVAEELLEAPVQVQAILTSLPPESIERVSITDEVQALRDAYLLAGVVGPRSRNDAGHVAAATVARADAIVSWNFRHIVRLDRIKGYNEVSQKLGTVC